MDLFHRRALNQGFKLLDLTMVALAFAIAVRGGRLPRRASTRSPTSSRSASRC